MTKKPKQPDLEQSFTEINALIEQMETGKLSLDESLKHFERGINLIKHAQVILNEAEQKVQILMKTNQQDTLTDFESHNE